MKKKLVILGGEPAFEQKITITEPTLPAYETIEAQIRSILQTRMITNAKYVKQFEERLKEHLGVKNIIATSCCTSSLMLLFKSLALKGEVILPSFTFSATGHAVLWNNLVPIFVDVDPQTYNLDPARVKEAITDKTCAILGVHLFGNPAPIEELQSIAQKHQLKLFFDAAHGFGASYKSRPVGSFGDAESFSLSPTKLLTAGEGGIVATNNDEIAYMIKIGRSYADPGNYDTQYEGLSSRMAEFSAILGNESLNMLEQNMTNRQAIAALYTSQLSDIPGMSFQKIEPGNCSSYKDFSILIDPKKFGLNRDQVCQVLEQENIVTKKYFYPPLHKQQAFAKYFALADKNLKNTNWLADNSLSLPLFSHLPGSIAQKVCDLIRMIHDCHHDIKKVLSTK
ncbi:DegT/DnrJ/EryC1/StrS family aminotransferase [Candidatus Margulisiibacteriota bacterium]